MLANDNSEYLIGDEAFFDLLKFSFFFNFGYF